MEAIRFSVLRNRMGALSGCAGCLRLRVQGGWGGVAVPSRLACILLLASVLALACSRSSPGDLVRGSIAEADAGDAAFAGPASELILVAASGVTLEESFRSSAEFCVLSDGALAALDAGKAGAMVARFNGVGTERALVQPVPEEKWTWVVRVFPGMAGDFLARERHSGPLSKVYWHYSRGVLERRELDYLQVCGAPDGGWWGLTSMDELCRLGADLEIVHCHGEIPTHDGAGVRRVEGMVERSGGGAYVFQKYGYTEEGIAPAMEFLAFSSDGVLEGRGWLPLTTGYWGRFSASPGGFFLFDGRGGFTVYFEGSGEYYPLGFEARDGLKLISGSVRYSAYLDRVLGVVKAASGSLSVVELEMN